jgi:hypothetical protein
VTATAERRRGSRVSPRRRPAATATAARHALPPPDPADRRPFWIYMLDPQRNLMVSDRLNHIGERCAQREAAKMERYYGLPTEVRLSPRYTPALPAGR